MWELACLRYRHLGLSVKLRQASQLPQKSLVSVRL
jgi:hypothetical protein